MNHKIDVEYKKVKFCECEQHLVHKEIIEKQKKQIEELTCTLHRLKDAVAKAEICGVPLHHLSDDMAKHFYTNTHVFVAEVEARAIDNFANLIHTLTLEDYPPESISGEMLAGWKSGIIDARKAAYKYHDMLMNIARGE